MQILWITKKIKYDGSQLRPLFAYENFSLLGDSIAAWVGPCDVSLEHMVDLEDKIQNAKICGDEMLHFIVEVFGQNLVAGVALQRLLASQVHMQILGLQPKLLNPQNFIREGDDLYNIKNKKKLKLSISIAGQSAVSTMIHFALNIKNSGTPVPTVALKELKISEKKLAEAVMKSFSQEYHSILMASQKALPL